METRNFIQSEIIINDLGIALSALFEYSAGGCVFHLDRNVNFWHQC